MYVNYVFFTPKNDAPSIYVLDIPLGTIPERYPSECVFMVPGTVDPMDD